MIHFSYTITPDSDADFDDGDFVFYRENTYHPDITEAAIEVVTPLPPGHHYDILVAAKPKSTG